MDAGIGVGGLSVGKDELASSCFDLFSYPEIETGIRKAYVQTFRPISTTLQAKDPLLLTYLRTLTSSQMPNLFVFVDL